MTRAVAVLVVSAALTAPAAASTPTIIATPDRVHPGRIVRVHGIVPDCSRGDWVTLISRAFSHRRDFAGLPAVYARVRAGGAYAVRTRIPARRRPGRYSITGRCGGGNLGVAATLRVLARGASSG